MRRRILFVHSSDPEDNVGGGEMTLTALTRALDPTSHQPIVAISGEGQFADRLRRAGVDHRVVPMEPLYYKLHQSSPLRRGALTVKAIRSALYLMRLILRESVDLVCTNVQAAHLYGGMAAVLTRRPWVMYGRDIYTGAFSTRLFPWLAARVADQVVCPSTAVERFYLEHPSQGPRCAGKTTVVFNGLDLDGLSPRPADARVRRELGLEGAGPVVTLIGRLQELKRQHDLLDAAPRILERHPEARFLLVGDSFKHEAAYAEGLRQQVTHLGIGESVVFAGQRSDLAEILSVSHVVVSASSREAFGRTLVEAMAMEKPVVATRCGGPEDIVVDGETGFLIDVGDVDALANRLLCLAGDPDRAHEMGQRGRRRAHENYDVSTMAARVGQVFDRLLSSSA